MKVIFFSPHNVAGGAERVMTSLANELTSRGIDVYFVLFSAEDNFYRLNNDVHILDLDATTNNISKVKKIISIPYIEIQRIRKFRKICKSVNPDIIVSFLFMTNIIATIVGELDNIPVLLSERNDPASYSQVKRMVMNFFYKKASGIVCQSEKMKEYAIITYNLKSAKVIPNPLAENQYVKSLPKNKKKKIVTVGRLIPQKNHKMLIRVFGELLKQYPDYTLYIYGEGPLRGELEKQIEELGVSHRVFLPGVRKDVLVENRDAEVFVLCSDYEGYPNVLAEAMANGILSISTDFPTGTARELIADGFNGYLIAVNDEKALLHTLKTVLENPKMSQEISERGREIIHKVSLDRIANEWIKEMEEIINCAKR